MSINKIMNRIPLHMAVCMALSLHIGCTNSNYTMSDPAFRGEMEKRVGLVFPASAKWLGAHLDRGMDYYFFTAFTAPTSEINASFSSLSITWSKSERYVHNSKHKPSWFNPDSAVQYRSFETFHPNLHSVLKVLIDDSSTSATRESTVYLIWFETS